MHTWHWYTWRDAAYLTCSLLEPWPHGFFTQSFWPTLPAELTPVLAPSAETYRVKQVHGNTVLTPAEIDALVQSAAEQSEISDEASPARPLAEADGILTEQGQQAVWVATADCVPALVADAETGQVAAIHAGWRGTAGQILPQTIHRFEAQGSRREHLRIALGPAIAGEVYQVSTTVAAELGKTLVPELAAEPSGSPVPQAVLEHLEQLPNSPLMADPAPDRARIDIRRVNQLQLNAMGIQDDQMAIAPYCTYQQSDHFFSYRRDRQKKVQWSGIVSFSPSGSGAR